MTIVVDGREMTVLESTFIVSPNSVDCHGRKLTTKQDWISALKNLEAEGPWCAQTKCTKPAKILQKVSQITHDLPNDKRSNGKNSTKFIANICKIESKIEPAQLDDIAKVKYDKVVKLLLEGDKGKSPKSRSESIKKLAGLKESQQNALKKNASISFKEKDGKGYFQITKDARPLTNRILNSEASAETIAAYMLVTYSYPDEIKSQVESHHNLQPKKDRKEKASVNVTQEDQRSGQSSSEPSQREERTRESQTRKTNEKTRTPRKSSSSEPTFSEDGRHAIINGKLFVRKRRGSRDSGSGSATSGEDSDDSGSRFNSDESAFDQADDDRSPPRSTKSKSTRRKSKHKSGGSV